MSTDPLYGDLVPSLGIRILPAMIVRLRAAIAGRDVVLQGRLIKGMAAIESSELPARIVELLSDDSPLIRRAAARILAARPDPHALEPLWKLHCDGSRKAKPFLRWESENPLLVYQDTMAALRACVRLAPVWLEGAITSAAPERGPVHDLAYLLAGVEAPEIWHRVKRALFAKVPADRLRSLAMNIEAYRDGAEVDWLQQHAGESRDLLGPIAVHALVRLDAHRALQALDRLPESELYFTRHWHLHELLGKLPGETRLYLVERLREHASPWRLADALQDAENAIGPEILDCLLDAMVALVERSSVTDPKDEDGSLYRPLRFLNDIEDPVLLERLRQRRGTPLERRLADWLLARGPQHGAFRDVLRHEALDVLAKIGGPGFTEVVNSWLRGDWYARMHAIRLAPRRPDAVTLRRLTEMTATPEDSAQGRAERGHAAAALAACGDWNSTIAYIVRSNLNTLTVVTDYRVEVGQVGDDAMAPVLSALAREIEGPGAVLALGFVNRAELRPAVRHALSKAAPDSETALAAISALGWMRDTSTDALELLAGAISAGAHARAARGALFAIGSEAAYEVLFRSLGVRFHEGVALGLLAERLFEGELGPLIQRQLHEANIYDRMALLEEIVSDSRLHYVLEAVLAADETLREAVWTMALAEGDASGMHGSKATAIRALASLDSMAAFMAASAALRDRRNDMREPYVYVLVEIAPERARTELLEHAKSEVSTSVMWAIGRALSKLELREELLTLLGSPKPDEREAACRVAARLRPEDWLTNALRERLEDANRDVARAATRALSLLAEAHITQRLVEAIGAEEDAPHRWALLDALLAVGDPGDEGSHWPEWASHVSRKLPLAMRKHLVKRIEERQKEVRRESKRKDD